MVVTVGNSTVYVMSVYPMWRFLLPMWYCMVPWCVCVCGRGGGKGGETGFLATSSAREAPFPRGGVLLLPPPLYSGGGNSVPPEIRFSTQLFWGLKSGLVPLSKSLGSGLWASGKHWGSTWEAWLSAWEAQRLGVKKPEENVGSKLPGYSFYNIREGYGMVVWRVGGGGAGWGEGVLEFYRKAP